MGIFQQLLDGLTQQAALIDADDWTILAVNDAWKRTTDLNGFSDFKPGNNYHDELNKIAGEGYRPAQMVIGAVEELRQRKRTSFRTVYEAGGRQAGKKFEVRFALMTVAGREYIRVTRYDVTELMQLRRMRNGFSSKIMKAQEEERRRMGRELHDSSLQLLAGLSLSLARLKQVKSDVVAVEVIADMEGLLLEAQKELRSVSFLAHPPQLERLGLLDALHGLVQGFGKRAGLETSFTIEGDCEVGSPEVEHAIYRMVQEGLSNVLRHAHASELTLKLIARKRTMHVILADNGRGIPADLNPGVGLQGMRSRTRELGGRLTIHRASPGTVLAASLPLAMLLDEASFAANS
ncbi:MAG TPA: ATP-binding protein [Croceibacterium sp.]|nr:ATP-binding protein [Croceibacterium sp.]